MHQLLLKQSKTLVGPPIRPWPPADWCVGSQVRRRVTTHEVDIKGLEEAVRGQGMESPREEIARLRRLQIEPEHSRSDLKKKVGPSSAGWGQVATGPARGGWAKPPSPFPSKSSFLHSIQELLPCHFRIWLNTFFCNNQFGFLLWYDMSSQLCAPNH